MDTNEANHNLEQIWNWELETANLSLPIAVIVRSKLEN